MSVNYKWEKRGNSGKIGLSIHNLYNRRNLLG